MRNQTHSSPFERRLTTLALLVAGALVASLILLLVSAPSRADEVTKFSSPDFAQMHSAPDATVLAVGPECLGLEGKAKYRMRDDRVKFKINQIANRCRGRSGKLKLQLWATRAYYAGGMINGYILEADTIGKLRGDRAFRKVKVSGDFRYPPKGDYYIVMTLLEKIDGRYWIVDHITFDDGIRFF